MDGKQINPLSLKRDLNRWLIGITLTVSIAAGAIAGIAAFFEAREIQDDVLVQFAYLIDDDIIGSPSHGRQKHDDSRIIIQPLFAKGPLKIHAGIADGFNTIKDDDESWRVYVTSRIEDGEHIRYAVAQNTEIRDEFAFANTVSAVLPIAVLALVLLIVINWIIFIRMKPIIRLAARVDQYSVNDLKPLSTANVPLEIRPFIIAINRLLKRTTRMMTRQKRFIADASHELRTPVAALTLQAENLQNSEDIADNHKRLGMLKQGLDRLNKLVSQLLDLARLQNTTSDKFDVVDAQALLSDVIVHLHPLAEAKDQDLGVVRQTRAFLVDQNGGLKQIFENAIANAINYSPDHARIDVSLSIEHDSVIFEVNDPGPGITDDALEHVFEPFFRGDNHNSDGNGLGLAICAQIARQLGGEIQLINREQGGLTFRYTQPLSND